LRYPPKQAYGCWPSARAWPRQISTASRAVIPARSSWRNHETKTARAPRLASGHRDAPGRSRRNTHPAGGARSRRASALRLPFRLPGP